MGVKTIEDSEGNDVKLVKMRNPWGAETYHSDYSDESALWTDAMRKSAGSVSLNDGEFFVPISIYKKYTGYTQINFNVDNITRAHHLTLNDEKNNGTGRYYCKECTFHKYRIISEIDQTVHVKVGTWDARQTPSSCKSQFAKDEVYSYSHKAWHYAWFNGGDYGSRISANMWK